MTLGDLLSEQSARVLRTCAELGPVSGCDEGELHSACLRSGLFRRPPIGGFDGFERGLAENSPARLAHAPSATRRPEPVPPGTTEGLRQEPVTVTRKGSETSTARLTRMRCSYHRSDHLTPHRRRQRRRTRRLPQSGLLRPPLPCRELVFLRVRIHEAVRTCVPGAGAVVVGHHREKPRMRRARSTGSLLSVEESELPMKLRALPERDSKAATDADSVRDHGLGAR